MISCASCDREVSEQSTLTLWDDRQYCRACVENACPDLADYASKHDMLTSTRPSFLVLIRQATTTTLTLLFCLAAAVSVISSFFLVSGELELDPAEIPMTSYVILVGVAVAFLGLMVGMTALWAVFSRGVMAEVLDWPRYAVSHGRLQTDLFYRHGLVSIPLSECSWEIRTSHQDVGFAWTFRARPVMFLRFRCPLGLRLLATIVIDDAAAMQRWAAFLTLAEVRHWENGTIDGAHQDP